MTGYGRILMSDWIKLAEDRVRVDQSAKVTILILPKKNKMPETKNENTF